MTKTTKNPKQDAFRKKALDYHEFPRPGKVALKPTTPLATQQDLALAYSPGVAVPCEEIAEDPQLAYKYTSKGNLVAVISEGTAVLGLGNIGALASKPVMEGKSVLFKKFANIDSVDVEIDMNTQMQLPVENEDAREEYIQKFVDIVASLEPTYGGINLEDIKAPECFEIERRLKERMNIPVFHDDQHGTAIIVNAAIRNWLEYSGRKASEIKLVANGAGASAIACLKLLVEAGLKKENIIVCDRAGVIYKGRNESMDVEKERFANDTPKRTLEEAVTGADVFLGLSGPNMLDRHKVAKMADAPLIMALANPTPEIMPEEAKAGKPDAIVCTGRSDFTNQVNNVLCFPFLFRGALDVGATIINEEMKLACVEAIAALARKEVSPEVAKVYKGENLTFGPDYLIPKPFDPRLIVDLPMAVAKAAMDTGVATRPIKDFDEYKRKLRGFFIRSQLVMQPIMERAKSAPKRIVYCEAEQKNVLQAVQTVLDDGLAKPILVGRKKVVQTRIDKLGLRIDLDKDVLLIDPQNDKRYTKYWNSYHTIMERQGVTTFDAKTVVRTNTTVIGALLIHNGEADSLICGTEGHYHDHLKDIIDIIGLKPHLETPAAMNALVLNTGTYFFCDTHVNTNPTPEQIADMTIMAATKVSRFGIEPKIALLSHSDFGSVSDCDKASKMQKAYTIIRERAPELEIDGEMKANTALDAKLRNIIMPNSTLKGRANLFITPDASSANIAFNMLRVLGDGIGIGPMLLGANAPAHIATPSVSARGLVNISAVACVNVQTMEENAKRKPKAVKSKKAKAA